MKESTQLAPETLQFLADLAENNHRDWFNDHKARYKAAQENVKELVRSVEEGLNQTDRIEKSKLFRIYRDVRFSKDKSPYKTNFGFSFSRATAARRGGYYVHIQPGGTFVGGGFWNPERDDLLRIRKEFELDAQPMRAILADKTFQKYFGTLKGEELKTAPSGFDRTHPDIDLIRKKYYVVSREFSDTELLKPSFLEETLKTLRAMRPWFDYMSEVLTTDLDGRSLIEE